ncbi:membrane protein [Chryseobacterium sp. FH2]|uniref:LIC_10190 family membrane protein n=1 Tax=Chryseobacterium sp. FH2 TaxID=1674291 RepID=UPI00065A9949|nr:hypothetical protein [Chryseobacterium sp. FH2]KMQ59878.1 membrane protein [Chryseobacterium sp. FH2]
MFLVLLSTIFIVPILMGWGKIMDFFFGQLLTGISGKILSGIFIISLFWTVLSFFIPLSIYIESITILLGIFFFFKNKLYLNFYQLPKEKVLLLSLITLIILFCSSFHPFILDHFGYYIPTIKWLTEYGLVKGISNLDLTLGQMSVWHIFQAGFSHFADPFLRINAILLIVYSIYIIEKKSWMQLCFLPILLLFSQSPSPDLPVIIFSLIILNEILNSNKNIKLLFAFSAFVFVIKPTMIWLPILAFFYSIFIIKSNFKNFIPGILIILLFCLKNIWTFGYPVFPVSIGDFGIGWKPNPEMLKISSQYAILKTYDMQYSYEKIQNFSGIGYIKNWVFLSGIKSTINILFIVSLFVFIVFAFIKKNKTISLICISILIKSILIILFSAQYRFFIDVFFVIFFVIFFNYFNRNKSLVIFSALSIFFITFLSFPDFVQQLVPSFRLGNFMTKFDKSQFYKPADYEYKKFNSFKIGNLKFNVSKNYPYNFDTQLPAISTSFIFDDVDANIFPQLIDENNMQKGFIWKNLTEKEKKEAENVINTIKSTDK